MGAATEAFLIATDKRMETDWKKQCKTDIASRQQYKLQNFENLQQELSKPNNIGSQNIPINKIGDDKNQGKKVNKAYKKELIDAINEKEANRQNDREIELKLCEIHNKNSQRKFGHHQPVKKPLINQVIDEKPAESAKELPLPNDAMLDDVKYEIREILKKQRIFENEKTIQKFNRSREGKLLNKVEDNKADQGGDLFRNSDDQGSDLKNKLKDQRVKNLKQALESQKTRELDQLCLDLEISKQNSIKEDAKRKHDAEMKMKKSQQAKQGEIILKQQMQEKTVKDTEEKQNYCSFNTNDSGSSAVDFPKENRAKLIKNRRKKCMLKNSKSKLQIKDSVKSNKTYLKY